MLEEVEIGQVYLSPTGRPFIVDAVARHAQDCSHAMVVYRNLHPTLDAPANTTWVLSYSLFCKQFRGVMDGEFKPSSS